MPRLTVSLTAFLLEKYSKDPSVAKKIDAIIDDFVPSYTKARGLTASILWLLENFTLSQIDQYISFPKD
jgi:hypothetical protein